jgi:hypothetical protein
MTARLGKILGGGVAALLFVGLALVVAYKIACYVMVPTSDEALEVFAQYGKDPGEFVTEEEIADPLIVARGDVVPLVIAALDDIEIPRRRHALYFLGNTGRKDALPALRRILDDPTAAAVLRGDALDAIAMIDLEEGKRLAARWSSTPELHFLNFMATSVLEGRVSERRSYDDALSSYLCVKLTGC